jgi:hypothetical protein
LGGISCDTLLMPIRPTLSLLFRTGLSTLPGEYAASSCFKFTECLSPSHSSGSASHSSGSAQETVKGGLGGGGGERNTRSFFSYHDYSWQSSNRTPSDRISPQSDGFFRWTRCQTYRRGPDIEQILKATDLSGSGGCPI